MLMENNYIYATCGFTSSSGTVISMEDAISIVKSNLIIIIDNENKISNYDLFKLMYNVVGKENRVILVGVGLDEDYAKNIHCLAVAKSIYDIYEVDSIDIIDAEYIGCILRKKSTLEDVKNYVGDDVVFSETIGVILIEIINKCTECDNNGLLEYIKMNIDVLKNSIYYNECMRSLNDKLARELEGLKESNQGILDKYTEMKKSIDEKQANIDKLNHNIDSIKMQLTTLKEDNNGLMTRLNSSGPVVAGFQQVYTSTLPHCRTKNVLYFKEITYVRYVNSLIMSIMKMLKMGTEGTKLKVKLIIYDNKNDFSSIYKPLNIVTLQDYLQNKDRMLSVESMVVVDPNHVIIEDMLKRDYDLLIIYDRLKLNKDLVHGNNVYKYWVLNSMHNYASLKSEIVDTKYVITRPGVMNNCLAIPQIKDYNGVSESAKICKYRALKNECENPSGLIVENILQRVGIQLAGRR